MSFVYRMFLHCVGAATAVLPFVPAAAAQPAAPQGVSKPGDAKKMSGAAAKCPPFDPKTAMEALNVEASSNKSGCWIRDPVTGRTQFISKAPPKRQYKPILGVIRIEWSGPDDDAGAYYIIDGAGKVVEEAELLRGGAEVGLRPGTYTVWVDYRDSSTRCGVSNCHGESGLEPYNFRQTVTVSAGQTVMLFPTAQYLNVYLGPQSWTWRVKATGGMSAGTRAGSPAGVGIGKVQMLVGPGEYSVEMGFQSGPTGTGKWCGEKTQTVTVSAGGNTDVRFTSPCAASAR